MYLVSIEGNKSLTSCWKNLVLGGKTLISKQRGHTFLVSDEQVSAHIKILLHSSLQIIL